MTGRDRIVMVAVVAIVAVGAAWLLVVSPERHKASSLGAQVSSARAQLSTAEGTLHSARAAQQQYAQSYAAIVSLGKAVPADQEVPSLIYQLEQASNNKKVEFASIVAGGGSGSQSSSAGPSAGASGAAAALTPAGFTQMPFTFVFNGSFFDLEHLFHQLDGFIVHGRGVLKVNGRLLTIQSIKLAPKLASSEAGKQPSAELTGTITATAYVLPATQGLTGGATPSSPAGASPSTSGASSPPTAPAVAKVTP